VIRLGYVKMGLVNIGSRNLPMLFTRPLGVKRCIILRLTEDVCCWSVWGTVLYMVPHLEGAETELPKNMLIIV
jgi:hypothetical protein